VHRVGGEGFDGSGGDKGASPAAQQDRGTCKNATGNSGASGAARGDGSFSGDTVGDGGTSGAARGDGSFSGDTTGDGVGGGRAEDGSPGIVSSDVAEARSGSGSEQQRSQEQLSQQQYEGGTLRASSLPCHHQSRTTTTSGHAPVDWGGVYPNP